MRVSTLPRLFLCIALCLRVVPGHASTSTSTSTSTSGALASNATGRVQPPPAAVTKLFLYETSALAKGDYAGFTAPATAALKSRLPDAAFEQAHQTAGRHLGRGYRWLYAGGKQFPTGPAYYWRIECSDGKMYPVALGMIGDKLDAVFYMPDRSTAKL